MVWKIDDKYDDWLVPRLQVEDPEILLPSDSQNRLDMHPLVERDYQLAEKYKVELEELQRKDKKLRVAA